MKAKILLILSFWGIVIAIQGCQIFESTPRSITDDVSNVAKENALPDFVSPLSDPHDHVIDVNQSRLDEQSLADFKIAQISVDPDLKRENIVINQDKTFQAFSTCDEAACRIFFEELSTGQVYEIQGLPLSYRPFSDLVWISSDILVFDRWSQPHYGIHYAVDVNKKKLLLASPFPDRLPEQ